MRLRLGRPGGSRTALALFAASLLLFAWAGCAPGAEVAPAGTAPEARQEAPRHPLWRVEGGADTTYLLGSLHVLRRTEVYPLPKPIEAAFDAAEVVAFELDMDDARREAPDLVQRGMYGGATSLLEALPDSTGRLLRATLDSLGLAMEPFREMEPWLVSMMLPGMAHRGSEYSAAAGIDAHFFEQAKADGKKRLALETMEDQITVFDGLSAKAQSRLLHATLQDMAHAPARLDALTAAWAAGDTTALRAITQDGLGRHPMLRRRLLAERNHRWMPEVEDLLERPGTGLVIVGAAHLVGPQSVVALLRQRGYYVEQL